MRKGDAVQNEYLWVGKILSISRAGNILLQWLTGPLKGREANVPRVHLKRVQQWEPAPSP